MYLVWFGFFSGITKLEPKFRRVLQDQILIIFSVESNSSHAVCKAHSGYPAPALRWGDSWTGESIQHQQVGAIQYCQHFPNINDLRATWFCTQTATWPPAPLWYHWVRPSVTRTTSPSPAPWSSGEAKVRKYKFMKFQQMTSFLYFVFRCDPAPGRHPDPDQPLSPDDSHWPCDRAVAGLATSPGRLWYPLCCPDTIFLFIR